MQPVTFYQGTAPGQTSSTSTRYYWVENDSQYITLHYSPGAAPEHKPHPMRIEYSVANGYEITAGDQRVAATWNLEGKLAVWGPDFDSIQVGATMTLSYPSAIDVEGTTVFYSHQPDIGTDTWGIYQWSPDSPPLLFESYANLGGDRTLGLHVRVTPGKLLLSDKTDVWWVDRTAKGAKQLLFNNPGTRQIYEVRPARPRTVEGGVLINLTDPVLLAGRDHYVNLSQPSAPSKDRRRGSRRSWPDRRAQPPAATTAAACSSTSGTSTRAAAACLRWMSARAATSVTSSA